MTTPNARPYFGGKAPEPLDWNPLPHMQEWLDQLAAESKADDYIRSCRRGMAHFANWAREEGTIRHPDDIRRHHLLYYSAYLNGLKKESGQPLTLSYRAQLMKYLRIWINWCEALDYIVANPWVKIAIPVVKKQPKPLEDEEVALLFDAHRQQAFSIPPFFYHRRELMLVLLYGWGLRIGELASLTTTQLDTRLEVVTVRNKATAGSANRTKELPYGPDLKLVVARYLNLRAKYSRPGDDSVFVDQQGNGMSTHYMRKVMTDLGKRAGVQVNPHRLRDTTATTLVNANVDIEIIMRILGHSSREQTMAYTRISDKRITQAHADVMMPLVTHLTTGDLRPPTPMEET